MRTLISLILEKINVEERIKLKNSEFVLSRNAVDLNSFDSTLSNETICIVRMLNFYLKQLEL